MTNSVQTYVDDLHVNKRNWRRPLFQLNITTRRTDGTWRGNDSFQDNV